MMKTALRLAVVLSVPAVASTALVIQTAGAANRVGPHQYFTGVINGTHGNTETPIPIHMACFGPLRPGETGHPMRGQTLAVHQLFPPAGTTTLGETGNDSTIDVFFGARHPYVPSDSEDGSSPARLRQDQGPADVVYPPVQRDGHRLVRPHPGRPALPVRCSPGGVRVPALKASSGVARTFGRGRSPYSTMLRSETG